jgi:hypothetical protein
MCFNCEHINSFITHVSIDRLNEDFWVGSGAFLKVAMPITLQKNPMWKAKNVGPSKTNASSKMNLANESQ